MLSTFGRKQEPQHSAYCALRKSRGTNGTRGGVPQGPPKAFATRKAINKRKAMQKMSQSSLGKANHKVSPKGFDTKLLAEQQQPQTVGTAVPSLTAALKGGVPTRPEVPRPPRMAVTGGHQAPKQYCCNLIFSVRRNGNACNNIFVNVTNLKGQTLIKFSSGLIQKRKSKKQIKSNAVTK